MKTKPIVYVMVIACLVFLFLSCGQDILESPNIENVPKLEGGKKYAWKLVKTESGMPKKVCKDHGYDCKKETSKMMTDWEWKTFFPKIESQKELCTININDYPDYVAYLLSEGFGQ